MAYAARLWTISNWFWPKNSVYQSIKPTGQVATPSMVEWITGRLFCTPKECIMTNIRLNMDPDDAGDNSISYPLLSLFLFQCCSPEFIRYLRCSSANWEISHDHKTGEQAILSGEIFLALYIARDDNIIWVDWLF